MDERFAAAAPQEDDRRSLAPRPRVGPCYIDGRRSSTRNAFRIFESRNRHALRDGERRPARGAGGAGHEGGPSGQITRRQPTRSFQHGRTAPRILPPPGVVRSRDDSRLEVARGRSADFRPTAVPTSPGRRRLSAGSLPEHEPDHYAFAFRCISLSAAARSARNSGERSAAAWISSIRATSESASVSLRSRSRR